MIAEMLTKGLSKDKGSPKVYLLVKAGIMLNIALKFS